MNIELGKTILTCTETGQKFLAQSESGFTTNYAKDKEGNIFSDEGVHIRLKRNIIEDKIIGCYVSCDGETIQGWKDNQILGKVICRYTRNNGFCGKLDHIEVRMFDGSIWKGKYNAKTMQCVTLRKVI